MLAAPHRLRRSAEFTSVLRGRGSGRASGPLLVVHVRMSTINSPHPTARAGFIVSKAVGNAVTRNRTKRVLRHLVAARIGALPGRVDVVIRANPGAAAASGETLSLELDQLLGRALQRARGVR